MFVRNPLPACGYDKIAHIYTGGEIMFRRGLFQTKFNQGQNENNEPERRRPSPKITWKRLKAIVIFFLIFTIVKGGFYTVGEQENAVVTMFGNVVRTDTAGLHFKIPIFQHVKKMDMTTHGAGIGYVVDNNGQNITVDDEGIMITSDFNFVNVDFYIEYRVSDPVKALYYSDSPEMILKNMQRLYLA